MDFETVASIIREAAAEEIVPRFKNLSAGPVCVQICARIFRWMAALGGPHAIGSTRCCLSSMRCG